MNYLNQSISAPHSDSHDKFITDHYDRSSILVRRTEDRHEYLNLRTGLEHVDLAWSTSPPYYN